MTSNYFEINKNLLTFDDYYSDDSDWYEAMNQKFAKKQTVLQRQEARRIKYELADAI